MIHFFWVQSLENQKRYKGDCERRLRGESILSIYCFGGTRILKQYAGGSQHSLNSLNAGLVALLVKSSGSNNMQDGFIVRCFVPVNSVNVSLSPDLLNFSSNRETVEAVPASLLERPIRALSGVTYR